MSFASHSPARRVSAGRSTWVDVALAEFSALSDVLLRPGKILADVEAIRALHAEAGRVEARDPLRAIELRRRASLVEIR